MWNRNDEEVRFEEKGPSCYHLSNRCQYVLMVRSHVTGQPIAPKYYRATHIIVLRKSLGIISITGVVVNFHFLLRSNFRQICQ